MKRLPSNTEAYSAKRERLLRAAAACFNESGYSGTSLKDIARHLNLTDAAVYYYIDGKPQLVYECYLRAVRAGQSAMQTALQTDADHYAKAITYIREHVTELCGPNGPYAIMSEIPSLAPTHREEILALSRAHSLQFETLLESGIKAGHIRACDVRMTGNAIMGAINWIPKWFRGDEALASQTIATFPDILMRGLKCDTAC
ncbi:MAG: TetR/AcrR family transcriptional regulator [Pseudomonadota bacterium]